MNRISSPRSGETATDAFAPTRASSTPRPRGRPVPNSPKARLARGAALVPAANATKVLPGDAVDEPAKRPRPARAALGLLAVLAIELGAAWVGRLIAQAICIAIGVAVAVAVGLNAGPEQGLVYGLLAWIAAQFAIPLLSLVLGLVWRDEEDSNPELAESTRPRAG